LPSLSIAQISIFVEVFLLSSDITIPSRTLFCGILNFISSACPLANTFTSRAVGRHNILAASLAVSSSGFIIIASPSFSLKYPVSLL